MEAQIAARIQRDEKANHGESASGARSKKGDLQTKMYEVLQERKEMTLQIETERDEIEMLRAQLTVEREERRLIMKQVAAARTEARGLETKMSDLDLQKSQVNAQVDVILLEAEQLKAQLIGLNSEQMALEGQQVVQRKARTLLQSQCSVAVKEAANIRNRCVVARSEGVKNKTENRHLEKEVSQANVAAQSEEAKRERLLNLVKTRKEERTQLRLAVVQGKQHERALKQQILVIESEQLRMHDQAQDAQGELLSVESKLAKLSVSKRERESNVKKIAIETSALQEQTHTADEGMPDLTRHLDVVEDRLAEVQSDWAKAAKRAKKEEAKNPTVKAVTNGGKRVGKTDSTKSAQFSPTLSKASSGGGAQSGVEETYYTELSTPDGVQAHSPDVVHLCDQQPAISWETACPVPSSQPRPHVPSAWEVDLAKKLQDIGYDDAFKKKLDQADEWEDEDEYDDEYGEDVALPNHELDFSKLQADIERLAQQRSEWMNQASTLMRAPAKGADDDDELLLTPRTNTPRTSVGGTCGTGPSSCSRTPPRTSSTKAAAQMAQNFDPAARRVSNVELAGDKKPNFGSRNSSLPTTAAGSLNVTPGVSRRPSVGNVTPPTRRSSVSSVHAVASGSRTGSVGTATPPLSSSRHASVGTVMTTPPAAASKAAAKPGWNRYK
jgi:hypothetical protein